jgi:beta-galactosidase
MPTASNRVRFKLTGAGKIIGVGNGDPSCHEADRPEAPDSATRSAFNGLCLVMVQPSRQGGMIRVEASAEGLLGASVEIVAESVNSEVVA